MNNNDDSILSLIEKIKFLINKKPDILNVISKPTVLIKALEDLNNLIGMPKIKNNIVRLTKHLIALSLYDFSKVKIHKHMLHTLVCGPPGVGKSEVSYILARIYSSLNILKNSNQEILTFPTTYDEHIISHHASDIIELTNILKNNVNNIKKIYNDLTFSNLQDSMHIANLEDINDETNHFEIIEKLSNDIINNSILIIKHNQYIDIIDEESEIKEEIDNEMIVFADRGDLVGPNLGDTTIMTLNFLNKYKGYVIIFPEAYSLCTSNKDIYGLELLAILNRHMDEHPDSNLFIFNGYLNYIKNHIFEHQPGIERRFKHIYNIDEYNYVDLSNIFKHQINKIGWILDSRIDLENFFRDKIKYFKMYGGDTLKLIQDCEYESTNETFNNIYISVKNDQEYKIKLFIDQEHLTKAFKLYSSMYEIDELPEYFLNMLS